MHDVIIAGAGLAGLQTARTIAQQGGRVLLIDRKQHLDSFVHTTGIFVRQTLESFSLPDDALGRPIRRVVLHSPDGKRLELESPHDEFRIGDMRALYRYLLQQCERAGVDFASGTSYLGSEGDKQWSLVRCASRARTWCERVRFVVGADGARSRVAADLGLDRNERFITGVEEVHEETRTGVTPQLHVFVDPQLAPGYIGWLTEEGSMIHLGAGGVGRFDAPRSIEALRRRATRILGVELGRPAERRGGLIPAGGVLERIASRRGLVVGDAAGAVSPLTAGGLDGALRLSEYAAGTINEALVSCDSSKLLRYRGDLLRTRFVSRLWMRALLERVKSPLAVELGFAALSLPVLQPFVRHVFFGRGSFPDPAAILAPTSS